MEDELKSKAVAFLWERYKKEVRDLGINPTRNGFEECIENGGLLETVWGVVRI